MIVKINIIDSSIPWEQYSCKRNTLRELSESVNNLISLNYYGQSIETFLIGLIAVEPIYDKLASPRRPRYTEHKETMALGSIPMVFFKTLEIEIKIDYEQILKSEDKELCRLVAKAVLDNLYALKLPKKVTDFDKERFVADVESVFRAEHLLK